MNIIITLTSIPNRLEERNGHSTTREALKTIVSQSSSLPYTVHFNVPLTYQGTEVLVPDWLENMSKDYNNLKIFRTEDYGSITKILPTLYRCDDPETLIIVVDDDLYYMDGMVQTHIDARTKYPDCAIGFAGMSSLDGSCHFCTTLNKDTYVKVLEGYKTVSYLRKFFDLSDFVNNFLGKTWRDDELLSAYMGYQNIKKIVLSYSRDTDFSPRVESFPVIGHVPAERGGCNIFRDSEEFQKVSEANILNFFKLGYLER
jgi:hypothetical protein